MSGSFLRRISQWDYLVILTFVLLAFSLFLGGASRENLLPLAAIELAALPVMGLALMRQIRSGQWRDHLFLLIMTGFTVALPLIQLIPLPYGLWASLPGREQTALALDIAEVQPGWLPLSMAPDETWRAFMALLPPLAMLLAALTLEKRQIEHLIWGILAFAAIAISLGTLQITLDSRSLYPWATTNFGVLVGFFANRNHMATLCLFVLPFAGALAGAAMDRRRGDTDLRVWLGGGLIMLSVVALGTIQSRFGVVAAIPALVASLLIGWIASGRKKLGVGIVGVGISGAAAVALVGMFALDPVLDRFEGDAQFEGRLDNWPTVAQAAQDFLPVGSGLGSFDPVYRSYEQVETLRHAYFNHAHNDYLELWLETGWAGIALIIAWFIWWGRRSWSAWQSGVRLNGDLQVAASVALFIVAAHSIADYPLRTATIAVIFALGCAILEGAGRGTSGGRSQRCRSRIDP